MKAFDNEAGTGAKPLKCGSPRSAAFASIKAEALVIVQIAGRLRKASDEKRPKIFEILDMAQIASDPRLLLPRGEPHADDLADRVFDEAIRFWAIRAASQITFGQWTEMVWYVRESITFDQFPGDAIRFFENRFEGLYLSDGALIAA